MTGIVAFMRARLDEDEMAAKLAAGMIPPGQGWYFVAQGLLADSRRFPRAYQHIARHDPARVLREVEAKRRIVDVGQRMYVHGIDGNPFEANDGARILMALALPYADHPDYRPEWTS